MTHQKPIDKMGRGPTRMHLKMPDGLWMVSVQPPAWLGKRAAKCVLLTQDQYERYTAWLNGSDVIQNVLPDLTDEQREIIVSGDPE